MRRTTGLVLALLASLAFAACSGGEEAEEVSPLDRLAEAKTSLDETSGVHLTLSADELPAGVNGLLAAQGIGTHAPAFEGDIQVSTNGLTAKAAT